MPDIRSSNAISEAGKSHVVEQQWYLWTPAAQLCVCCSKQRKRRLGGAVSKPGSQLGRLNSCGATEEERGEPLLVSQALH